MSGNTPGQTKLFPHRVRQADGGVGSDPHGHVRVDLDDEVLLKEEDNDPTQELDGGRVVQVLPVRDGHGTVEHGQHLYKALSRKLFGKPKKGIKQVLC